MLDLVQKDLDSLSACCERMGASLAGSRSAAADLLHDTEKLQRALQASLLAWQAKAACLGLKSVTPQRTLRHSPPHRSGRTAV